MSESLSKCPATGRDDLVNLGAAEERPADASNDLERPLNKHSGNRTARPLRRSGKKYTSTYLLSEKTYDDLHTETLQVFYHNLYHYTVF